MRYRGVTAREGERVVHNFPADGRAFGEDGFRYWTENVAAVEADEEAAPRVRCYCDWTDKVAEHYGTVAIVSEEGERSATAV